MHATSPTPPPLLCVRDLSFTYREAAIPALQRLSFELSPGELLVVMGASGAGKSTLCRCLNGLIPHFLRGEMTGEVVAIGRPTRQTPVAECARQVGLVFQDFEAQLFSTNVELEVAFGAESLGLPRDRIAERVWKLLELVGLAQLASRRPASLSGGEKQRLAIAAALAADPPVLVLDEATSDLDPVGKRAIFDLARQVAAGAGRAVVFAHHDAEEAVGASKVLVLSAGQAAALDASARVLSQPELLAANGVAPLAVTSVFASLGLDERPLDEETAAERMLARGLAIGEPTIAAWAERDRARSARYGDPVLETRGLCYCYGADGAAVSDLNLTIRRGEFVAIIGQNGSGKTTLVKHFNGLLRATTGEVLVGGEPTRGQSLRALAAKVGYVFQNPDHQIFGPTVSEEVAFAPRNFGLGESEVQARAGESLAAVGLMGREEEDPFSLTKGERQRVAVASVLAGRPEVLIFDEPTTGLDDRESRAMMALIEQLSRRGHTVIVVTHAMWLAAEYAHRVVVMHEGRVVLDAPTRRAFAETQTLRRAAIIPPQVVRLSRLLGGTALTVSELAEALRAH